MPGSNKKKPIVTVEAVTKKFGHQEAVAEASFSLPAGAILGLVGSDGAGKTTLLRMIAAMLKPSSGEIFVKGFNVVSQKSRVKPLIGYMPQQFGLYQDLTVAENLNFFMDIFGLSGSEKKLRQARYLGFSNLLPFMDRAAQDLSGGMKQKLGLACVLVHQPEVLILDEPTNGVDPVSRQEFWDILTAMRAEGMTILVSTAYLDEGEKCDRLLLMHKARILAEVAPRDLRSDFSSLEKAVMHRIQAADEALADERFNI